MMPVYGKMRGRIGVGKCSVEGHGHNHMKGAPPGYVCEVTSELGHLGAAADRRKGKEEVEVDWYDLHPEVYIDSEDFEYDPSEDA